MGRLEVTSEYPGILLFIKNMFLPSIQSEELKHKVENIFLEWRTEKLGTE